MSSRVGDWLPRDHRVHKDWLDGVIKHVDENPKDLHPVLKEFENLINTNARIYMLINQMFEEIPKKKPYNDNPEGHKQLRDYKHFLELLNHILVSFVTRLIMQTGSVMMLTLSPDHSTAL